MWEYLASLGAQMVKNPPAMQETRIPSWRREWLPTAVFLPGEFQGQRSYSEHDIQNLLLNRSG